MLNILRFVFKLNIISSIFSNAQFFSKNRLALILIAASVVDPYSFFPDPDPEFDVGDQYGSRALMTKIVKKLPLKKKEIFFLSKTAIYLSLGLHKVCAGYRRSLQLTKEAIKHFKTWIFSTFVGHFCPPGWGSGSVIKLRIRIQWSDWIRIQYGSGSRIRIHNTDCSSFTYRYCAHCIS